jgi:hypothetical protein
MLQNRYRRFRGDYSLVTLRPVALDNEIRALLGTYRGSALDGKSELRGRVDAGGLDTLLHFATRSAVFALRRRAPQPIWEGLTALSMVDCERVDPGDLMLPSALLAYAAGKLADHPLSILRAADAVASEATAALIRQPWTDGPVRLSDWGKAEVETDYGVGIVDASSWPYQPEADLIRLALEIGESLSSGRYFCGDPMIGRAIPAVWFADREAAGKLVADALGVATITGDLRPEHHPRHSDQMLTIFLAEMPSEATSNAAAGLRPAEMGKRGAVSLFSAGPLLGVVVGRSVVAEAPAFETPKSLASLTAVIAEPLGALTR